MVQAIDWGALELHLGIRGRRAANDDEFGLGRASHPGMYSMAFNGSPRVPATRSSFFLLRLRLVTSRGGASMVAVAPNSSVGAAFPCPGSSIR